MLQHAAARSLLFREVTQRRFLIVTNVSLPVDCFETSVTNYKSALRNVAEVRRSRFAAEALNRSRNWAGVSVVIAAPCILIYVEFTHQQIHFY